MVWASRVSPKSAICPLLPLPLPPLPPPPLASPPLLPLRKLKLSLGTGKVILYLPLLNFWNLVDA